MVDEKFFFLYIEKTFECLRSEVETVSGNKW